MCHVGFDHPQVLSQESQFTVFGNSCKLYADLWALGCSGQLDTPGDYETRRPASRSDRAYDDLCQSIHGCIQSFGMKSDC